MFVLCLSDVVLSHPRFRVSLTTVPGAPQSLSPPVEFSIFIGGTLEAVLSAGLVVPGAEPDYHRHFRFGRWTLLSMLQNIIRSHMASSVFLSCSITEQNRSGLPGCLASMNAKVSGRLDVYTRASRGATAESTPESQSGFFCVPI